METTPKLASDGTWVQIARLLTREEPGKLQALCSSNNVAVKSSDWQQLPARPRNATAADFARKPAACENRRSGQQTLFVGLGVCDLVDHEADAALGDDVRHAVANLDGDDCIRGGDAEHGKEVDHGVGAPANHRHQLRHLDLALHHGVALAVGGAGQADQQLEHNVQEKDHGHEPADPTWG